MGHDSRDMIRAGFLSQEKRVHWTLSLGIFVYSSISLAALTTAARARKLP